ncbi:MAG TPA: lipid A deacylase LpxR family protein [Terriglobia bacterium]|nr:lipid A deacylase LpxR family protein [Terriglobia bacterium]
MKQQDALRVDHAPRPARSRGPLFNSLLSRIAVPILLQLASLAIWQPAAQAEGGRFSILEENDSIFFDSDRYYTQGLQLGYLGPSVASTSPWVTPFDWLSNDLGFWPNAGSTDRRYEMSIGQQIFTPAEIHRSHPDPSDRPYAGWLYGGIGLLQDTDHRQLDHLELQMGIVGPSSYARQAQNDWHQFIGVQKAAGWDAQIHDEPGFMLSYERRWRFLQEIGGGLGVDAIPELGATVGNVMTYAEAGGLLRFGSNLTADYGPQHMRPSPSGTSYFNEKALDGPFGFYFYVGAQGRAVARNIFLDGNTFEDSSNVDKEVFVGDLVGGLSLFWKNNIKLDTSVIYRTKEYDHEGRDEKYAGINLSFGL